jgi:hypothetical protein
LIAFCLLAKDVRKAVCFYMLFVALETIFLGGHSRNSENLQIVNERQIQCFNNISCHDFEFAMSYRALPSFVNDPLSFQ